MALADIDTIVVAMLENRSFDHMLGYLSLNETPGRIPVDGLRSDQTWRDAHRNEHQGTLYGLKHLPLAQEIDDPAHSEAPIAVQVGKPPAGPGPTGMGGFVTSYATFWDPGKKKKPAPDDLGAVMGYYNGGDVPSFDFLARNYCVCDRWFAPLPLGTQANRLMAMAGESKLADNTPFPMKEHKLVYEWLSSHDVKWCVYQWGGYFPFFTLMAKWIPAIVPSLTASGLGIGGGPFRRYARFAKDWASTKHAMPNVIFVEPEYGDGPHSKPNDDHPPLGVTPGQELLKNLYGVLTGNPARWAKTLLIITYDEHGGFFDHVPPLPISAVAGGRPFATTGLRVPALLVSPHVAPGSVFSGPLDHSSILQLLDDRFAGGKGYSKAVAARSPPLRRISEALLAAPRPGPAPAFPTSVTGTLAAAAKAVVAPIAGLFARAGAAPPTAAPDTPNALAMDMCARKMEQDHPELIDQPGWEELRAYLRSNPPPRPGPRAE
jgi:phospholipase C